MDQTPIVNNARMLMEEAMTRSDPSFIGDAIDRISAAYGIDHRVASLIMDAAVAKARMYDGEDASIPLAASLAWCDSLIKRPA